MSIITAGTFHAFGSVAAAGASYVANAGFSALSNAGVGLNNLVLDQEADETQCIITATPRTSTADATCQVVHLSDAVKQVRTYVAGVLSDAVPFDVIVLRMPG
jgi:hypothetical protein